MKKFVFILFISLPFLVLSQKPQPVFLAFNKTIHMFFPDTISYFDLGSEDILIESQQSLLKMSPKFSNFNETNLTVITKTNSCFSFSISFKETIIDYNYFIDDSTGIFIGLKERQIKFDSLSVSKLEPQDSVFSRVCRNIVTSTPSYWEGKAIKKVFFALNNIFVYQDKLYFLVSVGNSSSVNYDVQFFKFYTDGKEKLKKSSIQKIEKDIIFQYPKLSTIPAKTKNISLVFVFDKFTLNADKKLVIELDEKNGNRNIVSDIKQDLILKAVQYK